MIEELDIDTYLTISKNKFGIYLYLQIGLTLYNFDWLHWYHVAGGILFVLASLQHYKAHCKLAQLRRNKAGEIILLLFIFYFD